MEIVEKAVLRAAMTLGMSEADAGALSKDEGLLLIRAYRSLYALCGGDAATIKHWWSTDNKHVCGVPVELQRSTDGAQRVVEYLEALTKT